MVRQVKLAMELKLVVYIIIFYRNSNYKISLKFAIIESNKLKIELN